MSGPTPKSIDVRAYEPIGKTRIDYLFVTPQPYTRWSKRLCPHDWGRIYYYDQPGRVDCDKCGRRLS